VTLLLAVKALLRKLGLLPKFPKDEVHYASERQKAVIKEIRRAHGFQGANRALDDLDLMRARSVPTEKYPPAELIDDMTQYLRAKYLPHTLSDEPEKKG